MVISTDTTGPYEYGSLLISSSLACIQQEPSSGLHLPECGDRLHALKHASQLQTGACCSQARPGMPLPGQLDSAWEVSRLHRKAEGVG